MNTNTGLPLRPQLPSHALFQKRGEENIISRLHNARDTTAVLRGGEGGSGGGGEGAGGGGRHGGWGRGREALMQHRAGINGNETSSVLLGERTYDGI